ncbi:MAG: PH domain-containing protein [Acidimicrobiales bacterium]
MFPRKRLGPGEQIVLDSRPHPVVLAPRLLVAIIVVGACIAVAAIWGSAPILVGWVLLGAGLVAIVAFVAKWLSWRAANLTITTARISYRRGVLRRFGREIPLSRVQDVSYSQSILERLLAEGALCVESAGEHGQEPFRHIRHPARVQSLIASLLASPGGASPSQPVTPEPPPRAGGGGSASPGRRESAPPPGTVSFVGPQRDRGEPPARTSVGEAARSVSEQLRHLDELHRAGVITGSELAQKRRELLEH